MKRGILLVVVLAFMTNISFAQKQDAPGPERYVVIGVFRVLNNAVAYTEKANKANFNAGYTQNPRNKLYYVYLLLSTESKAAFAFMMKVRLDTEYKEAWVYRGTLGVPILENVAKVDPKKEEPKVEEQPKKEEPNVVEQPKVEEQPRVEEQPKVEEPKVEEKPKVEEPKVEEQPKTTLEPKPVGKPFFFKLVSSESGQPLEGEIHIVEAHSRAATYQTFPANQVVYLPAPKDPSQVYAVSTLAAGYQEMTRPLNYADPALSQAEVGSNSEFVIALPLVHVKMGDYIEFSKVHFLPNSVLLQPSSKEELDGLAQLMKQNPRYKISVHGHCNGGQDRNIIVHAPNADFFTASPGNQRRTVSAKEFTKLRADLVKDYLIAQGIDPKRIATKGEGGKTLIYPSNSTLSQRNDRVEIEVKRGR